MEVKIIRTNYSEKQTLGRLFIIDGDFQEFDCYTLELPWKNNNTNISCIPTGVYHMVRRFSEKYGSHWWVQNVPDRNMILIHKGNYNTDTHGCILIGSKLYDINKDGNLDVMNSSKTMDELNEVLKNNDNYKLTIIDE